MLHVAATVCVIQERLRYARQNVSITDVLLECQIDKFQNVHQETIYDKKATTEQDVTITDLPIERQLDALEEEHQETIRDQEVITEQADSMIDLSLERQLDASDMVHQDTTHDNKEAVTQQDVSITGGSLEPQLDAIKEVHQDATYNNKEALTQHDVSKTNGSVKPQVDAIEEVRQETIYNNEIQLDLEIDDILVNGSEETSLVRTHTSVSTGVGEDISHDNASFEDEGFESFLQNSCAEIDNMFCYEDDLCEECGGNVANGCSCTSTHLNTSFGSIDESDNSLKIINGIAEVVSVSSVDDLKNNFQRDTVGDESNTEKNKSTIADTKEEVQASDISDSDVTTCTADTPSPGTPIDQYKDENTDDNHHSHHHQQQQQLQKQRQEERVQKDRSIDVYPETLRQRQKAMAPSPSKVDIKNWNENSSHIRESNSPSEGKKFLPSVRALRNQFEAGKNLNGLPTNNGSTSPTSTVSMSSNNSASSVSNHNNGNNKSYEPASNHANLSRWSESSLAGSFQEISSSVTSLNSAPSTENLLDGEAHDPNEPVEPIFCQFQKVDEQLRDLMSRPTSTTGWNPLPLLKRLYDVPEIPRVHTKGHSFINIEGFLEKLPSGRKKATFWNAWKRRYFVAKDGVLHYYQNSQCDKPSMRLTLMGGKVETMDGNMVGVDDGIGDPGDPSSLFIGIDDGKGHYVVVRCSSRSEAERWRRALESHLVEDFASQYVQPHPLTTNPSLLRDTLIIDIGSCSMRAGVLASQATLPQIFFPTVLATDRESLRQVWGAEALSAEVRSTASLTFPIRPSHRISKYSVDLNAVAGLLTKTFNDLKVDPKNYNLQISVPRVLNQHTQSEFLRILFEKFGVKGVNITHQSILALYAYNATSGIVVDIGERMDIVPVIDGYMVDGGVSRVPYGGCRMMDHLRQFLYMRNVSLVNDVESFIIRHVLESACYCAQHYNTEKARCTNHPDNFEKSVPLSEFFPSPEQCPYDSVELDFGRFQATEGLFNPDAWGLDHPGLHKLVHKAIQECSMDIRKEMSRSIFLAGGVTQLPGLADRLTTELDNLTPPAIRPKVHVSPYRYHAAYIGACTLAESPAFPQTIITRENWAKNGNAALRKWAY